MYSNKRLTHCLFVKLKAPLPGQFKGVWRYFFDRRTALLAYDQALAGPDLYSTVQLVELHYQTLVKKGVEE